MEFLKQSDEVLSVGEFSRRFKMLVKTCVPELWLRGEISNLKTYSSGHTYFTLKDEEGSISAVLFKGYSRAVSFQLREGMKGFLLVLLSILMSFPMHLFWISHLLFRTFARVFDGLSQ